MKTWRNLGRIVAVVAAAAAAMGVGFGLAPMTREPVPVSAGEVAASPWDWDALARRGGAGQGAPSEDAEEGEHDLSALRLVSRVMLLVQENYVDPERVEPREMLLGALDYIEKRIPEVLVDDREADETDEVTLTVNRATRTIELGGISTVWDLTPRLKEAFEFIQANLVTTEDTRRIEYAAINGMLSTLDPHSNLLDPEQYSDMRMQTRGEFGGLGFVVSMRDGRLTVMRIIPNTPAHEGGVQARDVITRIEDDSTINMDLTDAVNRLRGKPGTPVTFGVERPGTDEPKEFTLTRAIIEIESIDPVRLLADSVGYIRVTNFQGNTTRDLRKAVANLTEESEDDLKGLILDLRGNPGGLLEQAIQVADLFIERGTLVSTVGMNNRLRERKRASRAGTLSDIPLVVLVSNTSASASEIVSGAVRNLDRGLVLGNPTFGKGSVQVLYDLVDDSALKLTIAQYLTPGDVSIQDMGIVPDVELLPALVAKNRVMVFAPRRTLRESDLEELQGEGPPSAAPSIGLDPFKTRAVEEEDEDEKPLSTITFLRDDVPDDEEMDEFEDPEWEADFHVELARAVLARAGAPTRRAMLKRAEAVIDEKRELERRRIYDAISELDVDWSPARESDETPNRTPDIAASVAFEGPSTAGEETHVALTLTNRSERTLHRVRAWTESNTPRVLRHSLLFDRLEFLFGKLEPNETRTWRVPVEIPKDMTARREMVDVRVEAAGAGSMEPIRAFLDVEELPSPAFAFGWQVSGSEHGMLVPGEKATIEIFVRNIGEGAASEAVASLKNLEDQHVYITAGRHRLGELAPGETGAASMTMELREGFEKDTVKMRVTVLDRKMAQFISDEINLPVSREEISATPASGAVRLQADSNVHAWADQGSPAVASAAAGATLPVEARVGEMYKVKWGEERFGFVPAEGVRALPRARRAATGELSSIYPHSPPRIVLHGTASSPVTEAGEIVISGVSKATDELRDLYIFINNDKVFFRAWEPGAEGEEGAAGADEDGPEERDGLRRIHFETALPLQEGANSVLIFARKTDELQARRQLVVFREPAKRPSELTGEQADGLEPAPPPLSDEVEQTPAAP